jgi:DNA-directed RNA polymerase specialized sigma24 family protein
VEPARGERFEGLFRENYPLVRAYALRRAAPEAAQDVVADTFLVAWRRLEDVPDDALPWLYGIARRVLANQRRSADRSAALERRVAGCSRAAFAVRLHRARARLAAELAALEGPPAGEPEPRSLEVS